MAAGAGHPDEILIVSEAARYRAAALAKGRLVDVMTAPQDAKANVGSIYLGRVVRRTPGMNAAFVDIGFDRPAFLNLTKGTPADGKSVIVQVVEGASAGKAPRVSMRLALEGRFFVLLPNDKGVAPSRRLAKGEAARLTALVRPLLQPGEGVVLRAKAHSATAAQLEAELGALRRLWQAGAAQREGTPPLCLHAESPLRRILCAFADMGTKFVFGDGESARLARTAAATIAPDLADAIEATTEGSGLFDRGDVGEALAAADAREVSLPSGGRLAVETTTALVAIDVDSGGGSANPDAVLATNLEAAAEAARQLRLRELGGAVVIDFIRMAGKGGREKVERRLAEAVAIDRMPIQLLGWTRGGLFELVRARTQGGGAGET